MPPSRLEARIVERLHREARASEWGVTQDAFGAALEASLERAPAESKKDAERYLDSLYIEDLALACACAAGHDAAWEHFVREYRPLLYRAADALAPGGGARDLADGLYGELFGLREKDGARASLFRYFHGRSSLATWLRAVLSQRIVDRVRTGRRVEPLPEPDMLPDHVAPPIDPDRARSAAAFQQAMGEAIAALPPRDRLRLAGYYADELTLAQVGRLLGEHESTVSRQLARTRLVIHEDVSSRLAEAGLSPDDIADCFELAAEDAGTLDLGRILEDAERKKAEVDRSN